MEYNASDFTNIIDALKNFFEYVRSELFNGDFYGLLMHLFSAIPSEIRMVVVAGICFLVFIAIVINIRK